MSIRLDTRQLDRNLSRFEGDEPIEAIRLALEFTALQAVSLMRSGARWTDDTGLARQGLLAQVFKESQGATLVLYSQAPYGIWLEIRWSGKYAIVGPVLQQIGPEALRLAGESVMALASG